MCRYLIAIAMFVGACQPAYGGSPYAVHSYPQTFGYPATVNHYHAAPVTPADHNAFKLEATRTLLEIARQKQQTEEVLALTQAIQAATFGTTGYAPIAQQGTTIYGSFRGYGHTQNPLQSFSQTNPHVYANQLARINEGAQALHGKVLDGGLQLADRELALEKMRTAGSVVGDLVEKVMRNSEPDQVQKITTEANVSAHATSKTVTGGGMAVLQNNCLKCHTKDNPGGGVDLMAVVTGNNKEARSKVVDALMEKRMPVKKVGDEFEYDPLPAADLGALLVLFSN